MATRMQQRRGTAAQWTAANPILAAGEIGFETDTSKFKMGNGSSTWSALTYFANAAELAAIIDGAPNLLNTLNELAAAIGDDADFFTTVGNNISDSIDSHNVTTNVHGIANTALLATLTNVSDAQTDAESFATTAVTNHSNDTTMVHGIDDTAALAKTADVADAIAAAIDYHSDLTVNIHGIADTSELATTGEVTTAIGDAISAYNLDTTNVHGIADTSVLATNSSVATAISDFSADTTNIHGIADTAELATKEYANDAVSNHALDTTNIHGIDDFADLATKDYVGTEFTNNLGTHVADSLNVHGIADTSLLATQSYVDTAVGNAATDFALLDGTGITWNTQTEQFDIDSTVATKNYADTAVSDHNSDTTDVHGITDTTALATKTYADDAVSTAVGALTKSSVGLGNVNNTSDANKPVSTATQTELDLKAPIADPTFTGTVSGVTKSHVGLGNVDNTSDANKPVSTATQTGLDLKANLAAPTFTGTVVLPSTTSIGNVSATELGYVDGVTSAIQTQIDSKLALAGGTMTGALTLSGAPTSDLHAATKLYVDNVTAGINFHESVHAASTVTLAANYSNGTSGVGATLTADTNRAFSTLDGESVTLGQRVLIKNQTDAKQNGIYTLTTVGSVSAPWVLTRAADADNNPNGEMKTGDFTFVVNGTVNASVGYINNSTANPIVIGTDNISYTEFNAGKTVVAGSGLTEVTPGTLSVATGGVTSAMIADGAIVDADINASAAIAQSKISGLTSDLAAKAPLASPTFTGTVTLPAAGIVFSDGTQALEGVPSRTPIIQKTASYTLSSLTERDDLIEMGSATAVTLSIPTDATLNFPIGTSIDILQTGAGQVTIAAVTPGTTTVNATPGLKLRTTWSSCTLFKRAANTWVVYGDLTA